MKKIIIAIIATALTVLSAEDIQKHQIFLGSYHTIEKDSGKWNQFNYGYAHTFDNTIKIGAYKNSHNKDTVFIGKDFSINDNAGVFLGIMTGYDRTPIGGSIYIKQGNFRLDAIPLFIKSKDVGAVLAVSLVF